MRIHGSVLVATAMGLALMSAPASLQVAEKKSLTIEGARKAIEAAKAEADRRQAAGVIAVVDDGGNLMAVERLDGTFPAGAHISIGKARTAALFRKPTRAFEEIIGKGRTSMVALPDFTPLQGGVPIVVDNQVVGAIGVSGAHTAQEDEEIAQAGADALKTCCAPPRPVLYIDQEQVRTAFAKGAVLVGATPGINYMVHASRRDAPGQAEIHARDTDIMHVLEGSATFVTGGTVVDGKAVAPDEIRGASIKEGETRTISKGDVIVVPRGTPHWFKEVSGTLTYFVVKVR
jgi:glc operon protein GlcG